MTKVDPDNEEDFEVCVIDSDLHAACTPKQAILRKLEACQYGVEATFAVKLAIEEALSNAVKHGNRQDQSNKKPRGLELVYVCRIADIRSVCLFPSGGGLCSSAHIWMKWSFATTVGRSAVSNIADNRALSYV